MIYNQLHTIRDLDNVIQGAQLTGVKEDLKERPDYICIHDNEDGTFVYEEWVTDDEVKFTQNS